MERLENGVFEKMKETKIICDYCQNDLFDEIHSYGYYLSLEVRRHKTSGVVFDVMLIPPIDQDKHFCGLGCLKQWLDKDERK